MRIHLVCGARPNVVKIAPLYHALAREPWARPVIVHTGQHYDVNMTDVMFSDLHLPPPDISLGVGTGTHGQQTAAVLTAYEAVLLNDRPDLVVVVGDVNSTLASALAATKLRVPVAHLEAGLRSFDRRMPEEINRVATDAIADHLWAPSADAVANLQSEGVPPSKVHLVGNIVIDSLEMLRPTIESRRAHEACGVPKAGYGLLTLHRPSNVDDAGQLRELVAAIVEIATTLPIVFPVHPRTRARLVSAGVISALTEAAAVHLLEPCGYADFMSVLFDARLVVTDSGGIQEETSYLGVPCLTLRDNTERPITVTLGTNRLCAARDLVRMVREIASTPGHRSPPSIPYWDGRTASRVVKLIAELAAA